MASHFIPICGFVRKMRKTTLFARGTLCLAFFAAHTQAQNPPAGAALRLGLGQNGTEPNDFIAQPTFSPTGRFVAFSSRATNLLPGMPPQSGGPETNYMQWYLYDRATQVLDRVSVNNQGFPQNGPIDTDPIFAAYVTNTIDITADGRFVVFDSPATNLVPNDNNNAWDVFLFDRVNRTIELVSQDQAGQQDSRDSQNPMFINYQVNEIAYQRLNRPEFFRNFSIKNRITGTLRDLQRPQPNTEVLALSRDAAFGACSGSSSDTVQLEEPIRYAARCDFTAGTLLPIGIDSAGNYLSSRAGVISADGQTVLVGGDFPGSLRGNIVAWQASTGRLRLVSKSNDGRPSFPSSTLGRSISAHGRYVAWYSTDAFLGPRQPLPVETFVHAMYIHDLQTDYTYNAALDLDGTFGGYIGVGEAPPSPSPNSISTNTTLNPNCPTLSADGRSLGFVSLWHRWVPGDTGVVTGSRPPRRYLDAFVAPLNLPADTGVAIQPIPVPMLAPKMVLALMMLLVGAGWVALRMRP